MTTRKIIKLPEELALRIDEFIEKLGKSMGIENRTELAKRAIDEFLTKNEKRTNYSKFEN